MQLQADIFGNQSGANHVRIYCYGLTEPVSCAVIHTTSILTGNATKRNTNTKDQESVESTSVGHNNDTLPQCYTLTLVNAKFKGFGTKSNCQPLFKVLVFIN